MQIRCYNNAHITCPDGGLYVCVVTVANTRLSNGSVLGLYQTNGPVSVKKSVVGTGSEWGKLSDCPGTLSENVL